VVQRVAGELGLTRPDSIYGNTDQEALRYLALANAAGQYLARRDWQALTFEHTFQTVSGTLEYALPTDPPFHHLKRGTAFDRTNTRAIAGQRTPAQWQEGEALLLPSTGLHRQFRLRVTTAAPRVRKFYLLDDPAGAYDLAFEYVTDAWCYDGSSAHTTTIGTDAAIPVFDEYLYALEFRWRLLRSLEAPYYDEKDEAIRLADLLYGQENPQSIDMRRRRRSVLTANTPESGFGL